MYSDYGLDYFLSNLNVQYWNKEKKMFINIIKCIKHYTITPKFSQTRLNVSLNKKNLINLTLENWK